MQPTIQLENNEKMLLQGRPSRGYLYAMLSLNWVVILVIGALSVGTTYLKRGEVLDIVDISSYLFLFGILFIFLTRKTFKNYSRTWYIITDQRCITGNNPRAMLTSPLGLTIIPTRSLRQARIYQTSFNRLFGVTMVFISTKPKGEKISPLRGLGSVSTTFPVESDEAGKKVILLLNQYINA